MTALYNDTLCYYEILETNPQLDYFNCIRNGNVLGTRGRLNSCNCIPHDFDAGFYINFKRTGNFVLSTVHNSMHEFACGQLFTFKTIVDDSVWRFYEENKWIRMALFG